MISEAPETLTVLPPKAKRFGWEALEGYLFISPWLIGLLVFTLGPMLFSLVISFCRWDILNTPVMTGLDNYHLMWNDQKVWKSLGNTFFMRICV